MSLAVDVSGIPDETGYIYDPSFGVSEAIITGNVKPPSVDSLMFTN
jgi:hypothetical protein